MNRMPVGISICTHLRRILQTHTYVYMHVDATCYYSRHHHQRVTCVYQTNIHLFEPIFILFFSLLLILLNLRSVLLPLACSLRRAINVAPYCISDVLIQLSGRGA